MLAEPAKQEALRKEFKADATEMEGAAVAQVCHDYGLPFAALRVISDRADDSAHVEFSRFIECVASRYSLAVLDEFWRSL